MRRRERVSGRFRPFTLAHAAPFRLLPASPRVSDEGASFRLSTCARFALRLPGILSIERASLDACCRLLLPNFPLRAPVPRRFPTRVAALSGAALAGGRCASRHPTRFGGSRFDAWSVDPSSISSTPRGAFSSPRALRDRTSGAPRHRMTSSRGVHSRESRHTTKTASARARHERACAPRSERHLPSPRIRALHPDALSGSEPRRDSSSVARGVFDLTARAASRLSFRPRLLDDVPFGPPRLDAR